MIERIVAALGRTGDATDLRALAADLVRQNDALRLENAKLKAENRQLRRRLHDRELARLRRAEADCAMLGAMHFAQLPTTRVAASEYGISRRAWIAANALLELASVRHRDGHWRDVDMATFEDRLRGAVGIVEREGLTAWTSRMVRNGYAGRHVTNPRPTSRGHAQSNAQGHANGAKRDLQSGVPISAPSGEVVGVWSTGDRR